MRATFVTVLLVTAQTTALHVPRQVQGGETGPAPKNPLVIVNQPSFPLLSPTQALAALYEKAQASPAAVSILPDVPVPPVVASAISAANVSGTESNQRVSAAAAGNAVAAAAGSRCANPRAVLEWRSLTDQQRQRYVAAMKCLMGTSARSGLPGVRNRWDDLVALHQRMADTIHNVGQFLPWHSYFLKILESEMRNVCGYRGPMSWWDETRDAGNFAGAPMMTTTYFGRLTRGSPACVTTGVFRNMQCNIGPGTSNRVHCLSRGANEQTSSAVTSQFVNTCLSYNNYADMQSCIFFGPHGYGHNAIGGDMSDVSASPNDPLFHLHHGFVNRHWRIWQRANPVARTYAIGGFTRQNCGSSCTPTTLDYELSSLGFYPSVRVRDVMDEQGPYLCYRYDY